VRRLEEIVGRRPGALAEVDLALAQAVEQRLRAQVDQLDLIGEIEDGVGHGFLHAHPGDLVHRVRARVDVLDVERGKDVDAGVE